MTMLPGAGVERDYGIGQCSGGDGGEVGDASDVLQDTSATRVGEKRVVEQRYQRRALAACKHVGGTKV